MIKITKNARSLILCSNPLQIMIAEQIIDTYPNKDFDLLVASSYVSNNDKYNYYYNRLALKCKDKLLYNVTSGLKNFIRFKKLLKLHNLNKSYSEIYLASIDARAFQYVVSKNLKADLYTFDDGLANIITNSLYYEDIKESLLRKYIWRFLGVKFGISDIKKRSKLHFTIYKNQPNIITNTKFISLFNYPNGKVVKSSKILKVFLGQPLNFLSEKYNTKYLANIIELLDIDNYYPHPKERKKDIPIFAAEDKYLNIIESKLVFEDYVFNLLKNDSSLEVHVYSFFSSCIVNLSGIKRVKVSFVHDSFLYSRYRDFYTYAHNSLKIPNISIEF